MQDVTFKNCLVNILEKSKFNLNLFGGIMGLLAGLILLLTSGSVSVLLLSFVFLLGGQACFLLWAIYRTSQKVDKNPLPLFMAFGFAALVVAVLILLFKEEMVLYIIKIGAWGVFSGTSVHIIIMLMRRMRQKIMAYILSLFISILAATCAILFVLFSPFGPEFRRIIVAALCFLYASNMFFSYFIVWKIPRKKIINTFA